MALRSTPLLFGALVFATGCSSWIPDPAELAVCGDGQITAPEQCDDGDADDLFCKTDCTFAPPICGDRIKQDAEQCDDGNALSTDDCIGCFLAACGDSAVRA